MSAVGAVLVVGAGNVFFGDDGFGCEVVRRLRVEDLPAGSRLLDAGIRARHLVYELLEGPELVVIFDALARGGTPGTLYVVEPEVDEAGPMQLGAAHDLGVAGALAAARAMSGRQPLVRLVGCEPAYVGERMGLSPEVEAAVGRAVALLGEVIQEAAATLGVRGQEGGCDASRTAGT